MLLDLVEEPFDQVARAIQVRAETGKVFAIALRWDVGPRALLAGQIPDPVGVVSAIREYAADMPKSTQMTRNGQLLGT
jgi:hypothetical protein